MDEPWTVQDAKAQLSEVLRRARAGAPQRIGLTDACVVVPEREWTALGGAGLGAWLVQAAPRGEPLEDAPRRSRRGDPLAEPPAPPAKRS